MLYFAEPAGRIAFEKFAKRFMGCLPMTQLSQMHCGRSRCFRRCRPSLTLKRLQGWKRIHSCGYLLPSADPKPFRTRVRRYHVSREAVNSWWNRSVNRPAIQRMLADDKEAAFAANRQDKKLV